MQEIKDPIMGTRDFDLFPNYVSSLDKKKFRKPRRVRSRSPEDASPKELTPGTPISLDAFRADALARLSKSRINEKSKPTGSKSEEREQWEKQELEALQAKLKNTKHSEEARPNSRLRLWPGMVIGQSDLPPEISHYGFRQAKIHSFLIRLAYANDRTQIILLLQEIERIFIMVGVPYKYWVENLIIQLPAPLFDVRDYLLEHKPSADWYEFCLKVINRA